MENKKKGKATRQGNKTTMPLVIMAVAAVTIAVLWWRGPLTYGEWTKQTAYVWLTDAWYGRSADSKAYAMWIDDDGGEGVFAVKRISDAVGIRPTFAVIAEGMTDSVADALAAWQRQEAGIMLHGLRHERWWDWDEAQVAEDLAESRRVLAEKGFDTLRLLPVVVPPHSCNTKAVRRAVRGQGCQMVTGAAVVNPDRHVFQLGRLHITPQTDTTAMRQLLERAYRRKAFVIFGTHSSLPHGFSEERTRQILEMAKSIGYDFDSNFNFNE